VRQYMEYFEYGLARHIDMAQVVRDAGIPLESLILYIRMSTNLFKVLYDRIKNHQKEKDPSGLSIMHYGIGTTESKKKGICKVTL